MIVFFLFWIVGMALLYLYLRNQAMITTFNDVLVTFLLSAGVGLVFSFAASKANISHWLTWISFSGLGALITWKFFEKKKKPGLNSFFPFLAIFSGGLWIIPLLTLIGAIIFGRQAYLAHNSNSTTQDRTTGQTRENTGNVPYTQIGQFWFSVALFVATAVIIFLMWLDR